MKTVADIKKAMVIGSRWVCNYQPKIGEAKLLHDGLGNTNRIVVYSGGSQFGFRHFTSPTEERTSYCDWPKKSMVTFIDDNSFTINNQFVKLTYTRIP